VKIVTFRLNITLIGTSTAQQTGSSFLIKRYRLSSSVRFVMAYPGVRYRLPSSARFVMAYSGVRYRLPSSARFVMGYSGVRYRLPSSARFVMAYSGVRHMILAVSSTATFIQTYHFT
jgi:hypothetical protein